LVVGARVGGRDLTGYPNDQTADHRAVRLADSAEHGGGEHADEKGATEREVEGDDRQGQGNAGGATHRPGEEPGSIDDLASADAAGAGECFVGGGRA
jgi:hypothetical protein